jgi:hypothetical protein
VNDASAPTLDDYREACERLDSELAAATLAVPSSMRMALDDSDLVQAAISLDVDVPPSRLIEAEDAATASILVSCTVEARLRGASGVFEVEEPGWLSRSLFTAQTVRWSWFVTPRRLGEHRLTLQFRPVLRVADGTDQAFSEASILEETIQVTVVDSGLGDRVVRELEGTTRLLRTLEGVLLALAAVLVAAAAVKAGLWWRERRRQDKTRRPGADEPEGLTRLQSPEDDHPEASPGAAASSAAGATQSPDPTPPEKV